MMRYLSAGYFLVAMMLAAPVNADTSTLYVRLGGQRVVAQVVNQTIDTVAQDPRVNRSFDKVNLKRVKTKLVEQICSLTGGGCEYTGDEMKLVHKDRKISEREFYALVEVLRQALHDNGVGEREKNELLAILAPIKRLVVKE